MDDDILDSEYNFYQEISEAVDDILGGIATRNQKLELFNYLYYRKRQEVKKFLNLSYESSYNYIPRANTIYLPYNQTNQFYFPQSSFYSQPLIQPSPFYSNLPPNQVQLTPPIYPQLNYYNINPLSIPYLEAAEKEDSDSKSKSKSHHKQKDKKGTKEKKDKKEKSKKSKKNKKNKKKKQKKLPKPPKISYIQPICTCAVTDHRYIRQKWYHCRDCGLTGSEGMCEYCANHCHSGHDTYFQYVSSSCFCDCYDTENCRLKQPNDLRCTFEITEGTPVDQPMYRCDDCSIESDDDYICQNCAIRLHSGHELSLVDEDEAKGKICYHYKKIQP